MARAALEDEGFLERTRHITAQCKAPFLERQWKNLTVSHTSPETPILLLTHSDPKVNLKKAFDPFRIKVVSGTSFVGLGINSVRIRVPGRQDRTPVLEAMDAIDCV